MPLLTGLQAYWKFDESSGNAADSTANGNDLTNNGTVGYTTGKINNASDLEKSTPSWFSLADASQTGLDITGDLSINMWVNLESTVGGAEEYPLINKASTASNFSYRCALNNTPAISFLVESGGTQEIGDKAVAWTPSTATWYMVTIVYDASAGSVDFYVDGTQQGATQTGLDTSIFSGTSPVLVGQRIAAGDTTTNFDGLIDECGIWDKTLTTDEITELYNSGAGLSYDDFGGAAANHWLLMGV